MGQIFAHYTCTRVMWEEDEDGFPLEDPREEHGWVEQCNSRVLYGSRNDVRPVINLPEDSEELAEEVGEALEWLEGGWEDNGDGTFYSSDSCQPYTEAWIYSYAVHFTRKFHGPGGWVEESWHPVADGGVKL